MAGEESIGPSAGKVHFNFPVGRNCGLTVMLLVRHGFCKNVFQLPWWLESIDAAPWSNFSFAPGVAALCTAAPVSGLSPGRAAAVLGSGGASVACAVAVPGCAGVAGGVPGCAGFADEFATPGLAAGTGADAFATGALAAAAVDEFADFVAGVTAFVAGRLTGVDLPGAWA